MLVKDHQQPQDKGDIVKNKKLKQTPSNADNQGVPANVDDVQRDNEIYTEWKSLRLYDTPDTITNRKAI